MAYSNYEGKVFRNGEHWHEGCDGSVMLRGMSKDRPFEEPRDFMFHALLGDGPVRIGLRKTSPMLLVQADDGVFDGGYLTGEHGTGEHDGWRFTYTHIGNHADISLRSPDGETWTGIAAYEAWESWCEEDQI